MDDVVWILAAAMLALRLVSVRRFWRLPAKHGGYKFFTVDLGAEVWRREGPGLLRRYRGWLLAPFAVDAVALAALAFAGRAEYAMHEQLVMTVLGAIYYNSLAVHFAYKAKALEPAGDVPRPTAVLLSLRPRRLRDHSNRIVEAAVVGPSLAGLAALAVLVERDEPEPFLAQAVWLLYAQAGLLLLKIVFVRWRMKLPVRRTEEFTRWRTAWLAYHLRIFDAVRVVVAVGMLQPLAYLYLGSSGVAVFVWVVAALLFVAYAMRERRRLAEVERDVKPAELANEFPQPPVAAGRYLAGGLLYFNPENPGVVARGPSGIALNLANRSTYLWFAYLVGFVLLVTWQVGG
jgi:hypothetical protein